MPDTLQVVLEVEVLIETPLSPNRQNLFQNTIHVVHCRPEFGTIFWFRVHSGIPQCQKTN